MCHKRPSGRRQIQGLHPPPVNFLIFLKRLSDVLEDEVERLGGEFGGKEIAADLVEQDHELVRFYMALPQYLRPRHRRRS